MKVCRSVAQALEGIEDGATIMAGGFGLVGIPVNLIRGLVDLRVVPGHGLVARCKLALGLPLANEAHGLMTLGAVNFVSIGFTSNPGSLEERVIGDCDVMDVSLVTFGDDPAATVRWMPPTSRSCGRDALAALAPPGDPAAYLG